MFQKRFKNEYKLAVLLEAIAGHLFDYIILNKVNSKVTDVSVLN